MVTVLDVGVYVASSDRLALFRFVLFSYTSGKSDEFRFVNMHKCVSEMNINSRVVVKRSRIQLLPTFFLF